MGLSKAFGAINHELHISKFCAYGFCTNEPVLNYLSNRNQRVKSSNNFSSWTESKA